jgi:CPA2 family monovalent cation:H+ antiporter-2
VVIAGLAVPLAPAIGPVAAAYVLVLAVVGPLLARFVEPVAERLRIVAPLPVPAGAGRVPPRR